jgi:hypothetical protein
LIHRSDRAITSDLLGAPAARSGIIRAMRVAGVVVGVGVVLLAACGGSSVGAAHQPNVATTTTTSRPLRVGETAHHAVAETVAFFADNMLDQRGTNLPIGNQSIAHIHACAAADSPTATVAASDFVLTLTDGEVLTGAANPNFEQPLRLTRLDPAQCVSGNVSWHAPNDKGVPHSITDVRHGVSWIVSCSQQQAFGACIDPLPKGGVVTPPAGFSGQELCQSAGPEIVPISGSPTPPKNWWTLSPAQLRAAGWRILPTPTTSCPPG